MATRLMGPIGSRMPLMNSGAYMNLPLTGSYRAPTSPPRAVGGSTIYLPVALRLRNYPDMAHLWESGDPSMRERVPCRAF